MHQDRGLASAIGVLLSVAFLPFALRFVRAMLDDDDDQGDDVQDYDDDDHDDGQGDDVHDEDDDNEDGPERFFALWLDPRMLLSSARFEVEEDDLTLAQLRMMEDIASELELREGMRVLEVECGWGEFAMYLARVHGVHVTAFSRHPERINAATGRAEREQLAVQFLHGQVSEDGGPFDRIIRIAMPESETPVPEEQYYDLLAPGGIALVHQATLPHDPQAPVMVNNRFTIMHEDITNSFARTVDCWSSNLAMRERQGDLHLFQASTREWQTRLQRLSTALENGERGLHQVVYTKRQQRSVSCAVAIDAQLTEELRMGRCDNTMSLSGIRGR